MNAVDEVDEVFTAEPLDERDEKLYAFFQEIKKDSLKTLEEAARQIIGLATTLLGLFFGVLAFKDNPTFLQQDMIKYLGAFAVGALFAGLFFALDVVLPRPVDVPNADLTEMRAILDGLYARKTRSLRWALIAFGGGALLLLAMILRLLLTA